MELQDQNPMTGCPYGTHRVIEPPSVLPQAAWRLDASPRIYDNETLIAVDTLNIDAASFKQIVSTAPQNASRDEIRAHVAATVLDIVGKRGKMHNPVTGSGGMLLGRIEEFGPKAPRRGGAKEGDLVATLVSLSLTPLIVKEIREVRLDQDQIHVSGSAIVFESGPYAAIPPGFRKTLALAVLDVAGAPAQTQRLVRPKDTVLILGAGGKSGLLVAAAARKAAGPEGKIISLAHGPSSEARASALGASDIVLRGDAKDALHIMNAVLDANQGQKVDVTINCVNVPGTEMASIMCTRDRGIVYFFSMATSFTAAALGAEGIGRDVDLVIGNGYARDHARTALHLLGENPKLREILDGMFPGE